MYFYTVFQKTDVLKRRFVFLRLSLCILLPVVDVFAHSPERTPEISGSLLQNHCTCIDKCLHQCIVLAKRAYFSGENAVLFISRQLRDDAKKAPPNFCPLVFALSCASGDL